MYSMSGGRPSLEKGALELSPNFSEIPRPSSSTSNSTASSSFKNNFSPKHAPNYQTIKLVTSSAQGLQPNENVLAPNAEESTTIGTAPSSSLAAARAAGVVSTDQSSTATANSSISYSSEHKSVRNVNNGTSSLVINHTAAASAPNLGQQQQSQPQELQKQKQVEQQPVKGGSMTNLSVPQQGANNTQVRPKSIDLSHLYLPDISSSSQVTLASDKSHQLISQYLGDNNNSLVPRMRTIDLYRQNAKKSHDPYVLFQFAQYILQTALLMDESEISGSSSSGSGSGSGASTTSGKNANANSNKNGTTTSLSSNFENVKKDLLKEATHYLKKLSDKGYVDAQYLLADAYSSGALGKIDHNKAFPLFQAAAKHGHIESCFRTAHCFEEGIGTQRDAKKCIQFLKSAASRNHPAAMYKLGCYSYYGRMGLGKDDNTKKAGIKWLTIAVSKANELTCAAPYELARIYESGFKDILISDKKYALELYVQAASLGHVLSAVILGRAYELGVDVPQDANLSIHYYTQAALAGNPEAMLAMCAWYLVGAEPFLQKDENEAFAWALRSSNLNFPKAQYAVGHFLEKGIGCEKNLEESQKWIQKAARNGDFRAKQKIGNNVEVQKDDKECIIM